MRDFRSKNKNKTPVDEFQLGIVDISEHTIPAISVLLFHLEPLGTSRDNFLIISLPPQVIAVLQFSFHQKFKGLRNKSIFLFLFLPEAMFGVVCFLFNLHDTQRNDPQFYSLFPYFYEQQF